MWVRASVYFAQWCLKLCLLYIHEHMHRIKKFIAAYHVPRRISCMYSVHNVLTFALSGVAPLHNSNIYKVKLLNNHQSKFWWYMCSSNSCFWIPGGMAHRILIVSVWTSQYPSLYVCVDVWCGSYTHKLTITYTPTFQCVAFLAENLDCLRSMTIHTQSWIWKARGL